MIVEDNESIMYNLALTLKLNGYNTITATNGIEGLKILKEKNIIPDLILSDIMMNGMNGFEFYEKIVENDKWNRIPFVFVSAKSTPHDIKYGKSMGVDDYITKPIKEEELLKVIERKLDPSKRNFH